MSDRGERDAELLANIRAHLPQLERLLEEVSSHWGYEDPVYRFYHQSFKVYAVQRQTRRIVDALKDLAPDRAQLSPMFEEICAAGASGNEFEEEHNPQWTTHTRPLIEAFLHAKFFLEMAVKYGKALESPPSLLPSGWAALLSLYQMR